MIKKSILISILTVLTLSKTFSQVFTHTNPPPSSVCVGSNVILQFYVTGASTVTPYGSYVVQFGSTIGTCAPITATIPCTSWYSSTTPGTITATVPSVTNGTYYLLVKHSSIAFANSSQPTVSVLNTPSTPTVTAGGSTAICPSSSVVLTSTGTGSYSWNSGQNTSSITVSTPGTYFVTQSNTCGSKNSNTITVTSLSLPSISVSSPIVGCGSVSLSSIASNYNSINWSNGQSGTSTSATSTGSYYATAVNSCGSTVSNTVSVTVNPLPAMTLTSTSSAICIGQSDTLIVSGANSYSWNNGSTNDTIIVNPTSNSTYTVTGTGTNGCSKVSTISIVVNQLPNVGITSNIPVVCPKASFNLTASGANTYSWNTGANTSVISTSADSTIIYTVVGTSLSGCSKTATIQVSVYPNYAPVISTSESLLCVGQTAILTATPEYPWLINSYSWNTGANTNTVSVSPSTNTTYTLIATDVNFCTYTVNFTQNVSICSGVKEVESLSNLELFPNPNNGSFHVKLDNFKYSGDLIIINSSGKSILNKKINNETSRINIENYGSGIYFYIITFENNLKYTGKIIVN